MRPTGTECAPRPGVPGDVKGAGPTRGEAAGAARPRGRRGAALAAVGLVAVLAWASWPALCTMERRWSSDPRYTHGFLVPLFAAWLLWRRRGLLDLARLRSSWWGLAWVLAGAALKVVGSYYYLSWFDMASLLPSLAGVAMLVGGRTALRWAWPSIAFLAFMVPLPYRAEMTLGSPLQGLASAASTYALQTFGVSATAEGNVIVLDDARINVVEACNGMGMMFMFVAFATGVAIVSGRPMVDRVLIVAGGIPVSLLANVVRITATGLLHVTMGGAVADAVYHDLAGWLMMPIALLMLGLIMRLISLLLVEEAPREVRRIDLSGGTLAGTTP